MKIQFQVTTNCVLVAMSLCLNLEYTLQNFLQMGNAKRLN